MKKKILYNHWNYLSDKIGISSPCGGGTYVPWILQEFIKRGWDIYCGPMDRDMESVMKYKELAFEAFSQKKRFEIYNAIDFRPLCDSPDDLDILFLEWRFPTKDNTRDKMDDKYSPDLDIQKKLLDRYKGTDTRLVIFDLDYKLTADDELEIQKLGFKDVVILETALVPKKSIITRKSVFIPFDFDEMKQFPTLVQNRNKKLVYIGNNYERDYDFNTKLIPFSNKYPNHVHLVGNWLNDKNKAFREANPNITYHPRIGFNEFKSKIQDAVAVPLLAKEDYKMNGYMTMRLLETLLFGSIPVGFSDFEGIQTFLPDSLIVDMNNYEASMDDIVIRLTGMGMITRIELRNELIAHLRKYHDASLFVDTILGVKK